jgi:sirohydrochlorin cobaltochelatase
MHPKTNISVLSGRKLFPTFVHSHLAFAIRQFFDYPFSVTSSDFSTAALVILGHGTTLDPESAAPVVQHAAELRRRNLFAEVREAFWKQEPRIQDVLPAVKTSRIFIVPLFISEGYFSQQAIPRELGFFREEKFSPILQRNTQTLLYCQPVGTHPAMTEVILARAREVVEKFPFPRPPKPAETTLFIAGHGTEKNENSRVAIEQQVETIRRKNLYAAVHGIFLEEEPRISKCYEMAETKNVIIVPFFISNGLHVRQDIPVLLGEPERIVEQRMQNNQPSWRNPTERKSKRLWYSDPVGTSPRIADIILDRVHQAANSITK